MLILWSLLVPGIMLIFSLVYVLWYWFYQWPKKCREVFCDHCYQPINCRTFKAILPFINEDDIAYKRFTHLFQISIPKETPEEQTKIWGYYIDPYNYYWLKFSNLFSQMRAWIFYKFYKKRRNILTTEISVSKNVTNDVLLYCKALLDKEIEKASTEICSATNNMKTILERYGNS